jgi:glyoxylase-like metal-dependent hydrolase (beta-lactamase superfamily II)
LAIEHGGCVALVDTGIGLEDCRRPEERIGRDLIDNVGFRFDESRTAVRQLGARGVSVDRITDVVLTHADPDHAGGLADVPGASVHISAEELAAVHAGDERYRMPQFAHGPRWVEHPSAKASWHGLPAREVTVCGDATVLMVELFGHTAGHCGVAIADSDGWLLHAGDAYYLRAELDDPDHPVGELARSRAVDEDAWRASLNAVRRLRRELGDTLRVTGYHDVEELGLFATER